MWEAIDASPATKSSVTDAERLIQLFCIEVGMTSSERQAAIAKVQQEGGLDVTE